MAGEDIILEYYNLSKILNIIEIIFVLYVRGMNIKTVISMIRAFDLIIT